jgi:serine phosphatase RsbU (regulator of sigma subunit)
MLTHLPRPATLEVAARYLPAHALDQVGGDWYDAFSAGEATVLAMGDTAGHDITAAADMGQLRTLLRGYAVDRDEPPSHTMARLDRALENLHVDTLATIVLARVQPDPSVPGQHTLRWTTAGHPPPLLQLADGSVHVLTARPDLLVGVDAGRARHDHTAVLPAGSTLLLYTDGLIERRADGRSIDAGTERLVGCLRDLAGRPLEELLDALVDQLGDGRDDDIAVLAVRGRSST